MILVFSEQCLESLTSGLKVTLANIDLNNNVSNSDSNIDESKEEELQFSLNTGSDGKANEKDGV